MCHDYGSCILSHRSWCGCACHELITVASQVGVPLMGLCLPPHLCCQAQALEFPVPGSDSCAVLCICSRALAVYICESRVAWSLLPQAFKVHKSGVRSEGRPAARSRLLFVNSFALPLPELEWYSSLLVAREASGVSRRLDSDMLALRTLRGLSVRSE